MKENEVQYWEQAKKDLIFSLRDEKVKYVYFILTANIASIAFLVDRTWLNKQPEYPLFLALSIIAFIISTLKGFKLLNHLNKHKILEIAIIDVSIEKGQGKDELMVKALKSDKDSGKISKCINYSFYAGIFMFVIWRILVMYSV